MVSYPFDEVLKACLWIRNNAQTSEKRKKFTEHIENLKKEQTLAGTFEADAKPFQPAILTFSNSREGHVIRDLHRGSPASDHNRTESEPAETLSDGPSSQPDWRTLQIRNEHKEN